MSNATVMFDTVQLLELPLDTLGPYVQLLQLPWATRRPKAVTVAPGMTGASESKYTIEFA